MAYCYFIYFTLISSESNESHRVKISEQEEEELETSDSMQVKISVLFPCKDYLHKFFLWLSCFFRIYLFLLRHAFNLRGIDLVEAEKTRLHNGKKNPRASPWGTSKVRKNKQMTIDKNGRTSQKRKFADRF